MDPMFTKAISMVKPVEPLAPLGGAKWGGAEFSNLLAGALDGLKTQKADADKQLNAWMNGEAVDLHQVATSIQKAELSFELAIEVRNKMMQAYQEVMRMQI
ncbi:MAG: flagellar hook-basal body complex protein FliE [Acidobacteriota bacterium]